MKLSEIASRISGELLGDGEIVVHSFRPLTDATAGDLTFVDDAKYMADWHLSQAAAAIVGLNVEQNGKPIIRVAQPLLAFASLIQQTKRKPKKPRENIHATATIHPSAKIGANCIVAAHAVIGEECVIGENCVIQAGVSIGAFCALGNDVLLHPNVVIYDETQIGNRVVIHANTVIGADGFGYRNVKGVHVKVPQLGIVEIHDDVEIGSCTTIDRATFGSTVIGEGTKIDNQVQIAHNCKIGKHNILVSQVGIAGSCSTGDYVIMAGQVGLADHIHIGEKSIIGAKAGVTKDVPAGSKMLGAPATPDREQMRMLMSLQKLPDMRKDLKKVLEQLGLKEAA